MTMGESRQPFAKVPAMRLVGSRLLAGIFLVAVCVSASPAAAAPGLGRPGYTLSKVSAAVPATMDFHMTSPLFQVAPTR